jgi:hypothetical protein
VRDALDFDLVADRRDVPVALQTAPGVHPE